MKNKTKMIRMIALAAVIVFMAACPADDSEPQTAMYSGTANGSTYTLKIIEGARYAAQVGDSYVLTVTTSGTTKTSSGTVTTAAGNTLTLTPSGTTTAFTVTVSESGITAMKGTITFEDDEKITAPTTVTPSSGDNDTANKTKFEGTWVHGNPDSGPAQFTFTGKAFAYTGDGGPKSGTFTFDDTNITFTASNGGTWSTKYTLTATSITFTEGTGNKDWGSSWYGTFNKYDEDPMKFEGRWLNMYALSDFGYSDFSWTFTGNKCLFKSVKEKETTLNQGTFTFTSTTITFTPAQGETWNGYTQIYTLVGNILTLTGNSPNGPFTKQ